MSTQNQHILANFYPAVARKLIGVKPHNQLPEHNLTITQPFQIILIQPKMMPDFVQNRLANLLNQLVFRITYELNGLLEDKNNVRHRPRILNASQCPGPSDIKSEQQTPLPHLCPRKLRFGRTIAHLDRHLFKKFGELLRQLVQSLLDEFPEMRFAHSIRHR
jgi:hypothetical protein